jgi:uncharacterized protein YcbK (DUF882 family)
MTINYFSDDELRCSCGCGELHFDDEVLERLNEIREDFGYPMIVTSGYRCNNHPLEKVKIRPGAHTTGKAVDIAVSFDSAHRLLTIALAHGCPRVGVNQKGTRRFIHLDWAENYPSPTVWSY